MRFLTRYAFWVAAPLALASGCAGPGLFAHKGKNVDPAQRMLQIAESYEASGKDEAAERLYRQLAHMQPNNAEVQRRLNALAGRQESTPANATGPGESRANAEQLLTMLKQNREAYEAGRYGTAEPTLAEAPEPPREQALRPEPQFAQSQPYIPVGADLAPAKSEEIPEWNEPVVSAPAWTSEESKPAWTNREAVLTAANEQEDAPLPVIQPSRSATNPFEQEQVVAAAEPEPTVEAAPATDEEGWWNNIFEEQPGTELAQADSLDVEGDAESVTEVAETPVVAGADSEWTSTASERVCPDLKPELEQLVAQLSHADAVERIAALNELADLGTGAESAELAVRVLLEDGNPMVRAHAASALRQIKNDAWDSVKTLRLLVFHPEDEVARTACYMLGKFGPEAMDAVSELSTLRDAERGLTSLYAAEALLRIAPHDTDSVATLIAASQDGSQEERWFAVVGLASTSEVSRNDVVATLTERLQDESADVRAAAALSLGGLGKDAQAAEAALKQIAENDTPEVQDAAITALACLTL